MRTLLCTLLFAVTAVAVEGSALSPLPLTAGQAVEILKSSNDLGSLTKAIKVAASDPASRTAVIAFLDGPSREDAIVSEYLRGHFSLSGEILSNPDALKSWFRGHPAEHDKFKLDWDQLLGDSQRDLATFFAHTDDPAVFTVYQRILDYSKMGAFWKGGMWDFEAAIRPGSFQEAKFLDYMEYQIENVFEVQYVDANGNRTFAGRLDAGTGRFISYLSPAELEAAKTGKEERHPEFEFAALKHIGNVSSPAAYDLILRLILGAKVARDDIVRFVSGPLVSKRYERRSVMIYLAALNSSFEVVKLSAAEGLFRKQWMSEGPLPPQLANADPSIYSYLLCFLAEAEKVKFLELGNVPSTSVLLAEAKAEILALYAKHKLTPPTDAEIAALAAAAAVPPTVPGKPATSTSKPAPAKPTSGTSASTSTPLFVLLGSAAVIGGYLFFRHK